MDLRVQAAWQLSGKLEAHAGGAVTVIPPNIWQDNFLTGSAPFAVMPRLLSAPMRPSATDFKLRRRSCLRPKRRRA